MPEDAGSCLVPGGRRNRLGFRALAAPFVRASQARGLKSPRLTAADVRSRPLKPKPATGPCQACWQPSQIVGDTSQVGCWAEHGSHFKF